MKVCSNCGSPGNESFCTQCGGKMIEMVGDDLGSTYSNSSNLNKINGYQGTYQQNPNYYQQSLPQTSLSKNFILPMEYQPISPMGYFGYSLLFSLPAVGFVALLIVGFGGTQNINLRNYARGLLIPQAILWGVIIFILVTIANASYYYLYR